MPEEIVQLPCAPADVTPATHVRGSVLVSSLRSLRQKNVADAYFAALPRERHAEVLGLTAATWAPIELALGHYEACQRMALDDDAVRWIGADTGTFLNASVLPVLLRFSRELGGSPWGVIANIERFRERFWRGGAFRVTKLGPKEARIEWHGQPCAREPYFRVAFGAFMGGLIRPLAAALTQRVVPSPAPAVAAYRISWV